MTTISTMHRGYQIIERRADTGSTFWCDGVTFPEKSTLHFVQCCVDAWIADLAATRQSEGAAAMREEKLAHG